MNLISLVYFEHVLGEVNVEMNGLKTEVHLHLYVPASSLLTYMLSKHNVYSVSNCRGVIILHSD